MHTHQLFFLRLAQLANLNADFGDLVLYPTFVSLHRRADAAGRALIPSGSTGYRAVREVFEEWKRKSMERSDACVLDWAARVGIQPITVSGAAAHPAP